MLKHNNKTNKTMLYSNSIGNTDKRKGFIRDFDWSIYLPVTISIKDTLHF